MKFDLLCFLGVYKESGDISTTELATITSTISRHKSVKHGKFYFLEFTIRTIQKQ
jgi:hypothetical protein